MSETEQIIRLIQQLIDNNLDSTSYAIAFKEIADKLNCLFETKIQMDMSSLSLKVQTLINDKNKGIHELKEKLANLEDLINERKALIEQEKKLTDQEKILNEEFKKLQDRLYEIEELKTKKTELEKHENDFAQLEDKVKQIKLDNDVFAKGLIDMLNRVNGLLEATDKALDVQLSKVSADIKDNLQRIYDEKKDLLQSLERGPLKTCSENLDKQLDEIIEDYNKYVVKINAIKKELDAISEKHGDLVEQYNKRYNVDKDIFGVLEEPEAFSKYVNENLTSMGEIIKKFETKIRELVEQRNSLPMLELYKRQNSSNNDNTIST